MSVSHQILIWCDGPKESCPETGPYGADVGAATAKCLRKGYELDGWVYRNGKDYCPSCANRLFKIKVPCPHCDKEFVLSKCKHADCICGFYPNDHKYKVRTHVVGTYIGRTANDAWAKAAAGIRQMEETFRAARDERRNREGRR